MTFRPLSVSMAVLLAAALGAQETLQVSQPEPGTLSLGDAATVRITVEGRDANPRAPKLPEVDGLELRLSAPTRSSYTFYDGRKLDERVGVQYQLELRPQRVGEFVVPPFAIWTGTREQRTPALRLDVRTDIVGAEMGWLEVHVEPQRVYVHEPVRVRIDYGVLEGVPLVQDYAGRTRYLDVEVQANWLSEFPAGEPIQLPKPSGDLRVVVVNRSLDYANFEGGAARAGKTWQHFTLERAFLPTRLGKVELPAAMLRFQVVQRQGRPDVFGRTRDALTKNFFVYGKPVELEVLPIPEQGRPTPFYGAVGRFQLDAALDRDAVKVGESVKLTLTVRGQGNFEFLRMPELGDLPGFHKNGEVETRRDDDRVVVTYDLTPLSAAVTEVPSIGWNFFDTTPGVERFVELATPVLPLRVAPPPAGETLAPLPEERAAAVKPGVDDIFDLPALDGAPVRRGAPAAWYAWLAVLGPWLLVGGAFVALRARRRATQDIAGQRVRAAKRRCEATLDAGGDALDALSGYVADRLGCEPAAVIAPDLAARLAASGLDDEHAAAIAAAVDRGTAQRYGGGQGLAADDVRRLVAALERLRFGARLWPWLLLPLLAVATAGGLRAQDTPASVAAAVQAYRAGDYAAADAAFEKAFASSGDRRLLRARGNCLFREGDLPRALWAYESARLGLPRDAELGADLRLVRQRLQLAEPDPSFANGLRDLLDLLTPHERLSCCAFGMLLGAALLVFGWRRVGLRWVAGLVLLPVALLALDVLWLGPSRVPRAVALSPLDLVAEPRAGLTPVASVRAGVIVSLRGGDNGDFVRVAAGDHVGYCPRRQLAIVE
ncbi:MAG: BatD family protein [Planctomycetes bacterium]|nr:BatD family protein [Planctomycetota bacterium]